MKTSYFLTVLSLTLTTLLATPSVQGAILRVKSDAIGTGTGLSGMPTPSSRRPRCGHDERLNLIAAGIYYPDEGVAQTNDNRSSASRLTKALICTAGSMARRRLSCP